MSIFFQQSLTPLSFKMAIAAGDFVGWDFGWMEENKKSGGGFFSAEPTFFSRSDFFSDTVRDVRGEHREPPWA